MSYGNAQLQACMHPRRHLVFHRQSVATAGLAVFHVSPVAAVCPATWRGDLNAMVDVRLRKANRTYRLGNVKDPCSVASVHNATIFRPYWNPVCRLLGAAVVGAQVKTQHNNRLVRPQGTTHVFAEKFVAGAAQPER